MSALRAVLYKPRRLGCLHYLLPGQGQTAFTERGKKAPLLPGTGKGVKPISIIVYPKRNNLNLTITKRTRISSDQPHIDDVLDTYRKSSYSVTSVYLN